MITGTAHPVDPRIQDLLDEIQATGSQITALCDRAFALVEIMRAEASTSTEPFFPSLGPEIDPETWVLMAQRYMHWGITTLTRAATEKSSPMAKPTPTDTDLLKFVLRQDKLLLEKWHHPGKRQSVDVFTALDDDDSPSGRAPTAREALVQAYKRHQRGG